MKIGIIGGGNLGSVLAVKFSQKHDVLLYTNLVDKVDQYRSDMTVFCEDTNTYIVGKNIKFTTSLKELSEFSSYIFITFPAFLFKGLSEELIPLLKIGHHLVFVPGSGGAELFFKDAISRGVTITGLQRVHSVARIIEFGKLVKESGIKQKLRIATIPNIYNHQAALDLSALFGLPVEELPNYLNVTFVNSNPILHTSRLYSIFKNGELEKIPLFYEGWDDESSKLLMSMDEELFKIISLLNTKGLDIQHVQPLLDYYDSYDASSLTNKLISIKAFKGIGTPAIPGDKGNYLPDLNSRYFTADFPYGLDVLISFGEILGVDLSNMKNVSNWYHTISGSEVKFDIKKFGISNVDQLIDFYR